MGVVRWVLEGVFVGVYEVEDVLTGAGGGLGVEVV